MRERDDDLAALDALLDRSYERGGSHLRSVFGPGERLRARALVAALDGIFEMHLAVLSGSGAPLVAPVDGIFFRGRIWFGLPAASLRARLVRRDRRVSASYNDPPLAVIAHGEAHEVGPADPELTEYRSLMTELYVRRYGEPWLEWFAAMQAGDPGFTGYVEPRVLFAKGLPS